MTDPKDQHGDERIEELLSQLQGIFSKLSQTEEEEAKQKIAPPPSVDPPAAAIASPAAPLEAAPSPVLTPLPSVPPPAPESSPVPAEPPISSPVETVVSPMPEAVLSPTPSAPPIPATEPVPAPPEASTSIVATAATDMPPQDPEHPLIPIAICYPLGKEAEMKLLSEKLETITPKFTRVSFRLSVRVTMTYKPKNEWSEEFFTLAKKHSIRAFFFVLERPLEDAKRKSFIEVLEKLGIYFQEVPMASLEKKAFYTDLLLGLVFFFDAHKPTLSEQGPSA